MRKEWEEISKMMDAKGLKLTEKEVLDEAVAVRRERRRSRQSKLLSVSTDGRCQACPSS